MVVITRDAKLPIARSAAIDAHGRFEQALFTLFASLLGAPRDRAGIVFFRISSAPTRTKMLKSLLKKTHGNKYKVYWSGSEPDAKNGLIHHIRQLDHQRNEFVHWHVAGEIYGGGEIPIVSREVLAPPNFWHRSGNRQRMTVKHLEQFVQKADFVS